MSVGHRANQQHTPALIRETKRILALPAIKAYLARPYRADYSKKIPLTGGSSKDGRVYYIDPDVPSELRPFVLEHERVEKAVRDVLKEHYGRAHQIATCAERLKVEAAKKDWSAYKRQVARPVRENEKRGPEREPKDLDPGPYRESGEMALLK